METVHDIYRSAPRDEHGLPGRLLVITDKPERFAHLDKARVQVVKPHGSVLGTRVDRLFVDGAVEVTPGFLWWALVVVLSRCTNKWKDM